MTSPDDDRLARLREEFDRAFERAPAPPARAAVQLLLVRAGGSRLALRLDELGWLETAPRVTRVPGGPAALVGLAALRGRVVAVFDLAALASRTGAAGPRSAAAHVVLTRADPDVALSFSTIEGRSAVDLDAVPGAPDGVLVTLQLPEGSCDLVSVPVVLQRIHTEGASS